MNKQAAHLSIVPPPQKPVSENKILSEKEKKLVSFISKAIVKKVMEVVAVKRSI